MAYKFVGYFGNWAQYRQGGGKFLPDQIDPSLFTHICFAFGMFGFVSWSVDPTETRTGEQRYTGDYTIQPVEWNDQKVLYPAMQNLKQKNPNLKTLLSIGGWSFNSCDDTPESAGTKYPYGPFTCQLFSKMAADPNGRTQFIKSAIAYAKEYGFDGIDLDWEYPAESARGGQDADYENYLKLLQEFRQTAGQDFLITIASSAIPKGSKTGDQFFQWLREFGQYLDWFNVMSYDYHGAFDDPNTVGTGANAPLLQDSVPNGTFDIKDTVESYLKANIPKEKIVLGMPTYGRTYVVADRTDGFGKPFSGPGPAGPATVTPGFLAYFEIVEKLANGELDVQRWDDATLTPYAYSTKTGLWVTYDDEKSLRYKVSYAIEKELGGAMTWAIDLDKFSKGFPLQSAIKKILDDPNSRPELPGLESGGQRYNQRSFLCTHNAFCNYEDARWTGPNQSFSLTHQLERGVRALMLDTHYAKPGPGDVFGVIKEKGVYLLHGVNERGWIGGFTYALPSRRLYQALYDVWGFLNSNPNEVVTILLEDYTTAEQLKAEFDFIVEKENKEGRDGQKFLQLIYNPEKDSNWKVKEKKQWPLLSDLIAWNKRLIIFSSFDKNPQHESDYVAWNQDYTKENYWSIGNLANDLDCPSRWNNGDYIDADYPKLFVFNHFRNAPTVITAALDNPYNKIMDRINSRCCPLTKQLPNFVAVDFFEIPLGNNKKAQDVVDELNRKLQNNEGCPKG